MRKNPGVHSLFESYELGKTFRGEATQSLDGDRAELSQRSWYVAGQTDIREWSIPVRLSECPTIR